MKKLVALFILLNVGDLALTQYMLTSGQSVDEANPIIDHLKDYGWGWVWLFKLSAVGIILGLLYKFCKPAAMKRILRAVCIFFMLALSYMLLLSFLGEKVHEFH